MALPKATRKKKVRAAPRVKRGGKITGPVWEGWERGRVNRFIDIAKFTVLGIMIITSHRIYMNTSLNGCQRVANTPRNKSVKQKRHLVMC